MWPRLGTSVGLCALVSTIVGFPACSSGEASIPAVAEPVAVATPAIEPVAPSVVAPVEGAKTVEPSADDGATAKTVVEGRRTPNHEALDRACLPSWEPMTTVDMHVHLSEHRECLEKLRAAALSRAVGSVGPRKAQLLRQQEALHLRLEAALCEVAEQARWIDWDELWHHDGTMRSFAWAACRISALEERIFWLERLAAADAAGWAAHATRVSVDARSSVAALRRQQGLAEQAVLAGRWASPTDGPGWPLSEKEAREIAADAKTALETATSMAPLTEKLLPGVASALGTDAQTAVVAHSCVAATFDQE